MVTTGTVRYDLLVHAANIINRRGMKALWANSEIIASGDPEDLPCSVEPWREVSENEAWTFVPTEEAHA
ncbi:hypothetical protein LCGC14_0251180 [marine sediment metagenome]|uniref:Uncharacterized protein n=1 Tax=marine sediment metagenome TaxID=412755 RepID=A0A0F9WPF0_9ZZZZ